jgi:hypothetical protein
MGNTQTMFCPGCGSNFQLVYGHRDQIFCANDCRKQIQSKDKWLLFNICRILARHPDGLTSGEIARLMDEFDFNQNQRSVSHHLRKLCRFETVRKVSMAPTKYQIINPDGHAGVWLV